MFSGSIKKRLLTSLFYSFLINGFFLLANYFSLTKYGVQILIFIASVAMFPFLFSLLAIPITLILSLWRRYRGESLKTMFICVTYFMVSLSFLLITVHIRHNAFVGLAQRSRQLVVAIHQFERKYGKPPNNLSQLVPEFLPSVPKTGMGAYPEYEYYLSSNPNEFEGNSWILEVDTPNGGINFDKFMYFPKQNYPEVGYGGVIERIEDWAYVHE